VIPGWMNYSVQKLKESKVGFCSFVITQKPFKKLTFDFSGGLSLKNEPNQEPI